MILHKNKKSISYQLTGIIIGILVLALALYVVIFHSEDIITYIKMIPRPDVKESDTLHDYRGKEDSPSEYSLEWKKTLAEYEKTKCNVDSNCKAINLNCACFTEEAYKSKKDPVMCTKKTPYCYNNTIGCSDKNPENDISYLYKCWESYPSLRPIPKCNVDSESRVINKEGCICNAKYSSSYCAEGWYCYDEKTCSPEKINK